MVFTQTPNARAMVGQVAPDAFNSFASSICSAVGMCGFLPTPRRERSCRASNRSNCGELSGQRITSAPHRRRTDQRHSHSRPHPARLDHPSASPPVRSKHRPKAARQRCPAAMRASTSQATPHHASDLGRSLPVLIGRPRRRFNSALKASALRHRRAAHLLRKALQPCPRATWRR